MIPCWSRPSAEPSEWVTRVGKPSLPAVCILRCDGTGAGEWRHQDGRQEICCGSGWEACCASGWGW